MQGKKSDREKLVILGTSLFAPEVLDWVEDTGRYEVTAFVENWDRDKTRQSLHGLPIIWIDDAVGVTIS